MGIAFATVLALAAIAAYVVSYAAADDHEIGWMGLLHGVAAILGASAVLEITRPHTGFSYAIGVIIALGALVAFIASTGPYSRGPENGPMGRRDKLQFMGLVALGTILSGGAVAQFLCLT